MKTVATTLDVARRFTNDSSFVVNFNLGSTRIE